MHTSAHIITLNLTQLQSEAAEAQIVAARTAKDQLLTDILEAERQVMLWEKKITLEKEAQVCGHAFECFVVFSVL